MDYYSKDSHGDYLGQYGTKPGERKRVPIVRVDKAKQGFYSQLNIDEETRDAIKVYSWFKRRFRSGSC